MSEIRTVLADGTVAAATAATDTRVLILSGITAAGTWRTAMRAGALGCVARPSACRRRSLGW